MNGLVNDFVEMGAFLKCPISNLPDSSHNLVYLRRMILRGHTMVVHGRVYLYISFSATGYRFMHVCICGQVKPKINLQYNKV